MGSSSGYRHVPLRAHLPPSVLVFSSVTKLDLVQKLDLSEHVFLELDYCKDWITVRVSVCVKNHLKS